MVVEKLKEYISLSDQIKALKEQQKKLKMDIVNEVGENASIDGYKVYTYAANRFSQADFKNDYPDLYTNYMREAAPVTYITKEKK